MAKNYEPFSKSYCNGRLVTGPDKLYFISALILMFIPEVPFLVTVCPLFEGYMSAAIYVISIFLWICSFIFIFITSYTDPGIVHRGAYNESENPFSSDHRHQLYKTIDIRGYQYDIKWCDTCCIYRPPRANHCGICNNCIEKFDHHCPWVGNCIGKRNYKFFMYFLYTLGAKCLWVMGICIANIVIEADRVRKVHPDYSSSNVFHHALLESHYLAIVIIVYALGGIMFVGSLGSFHCFLIATAQSTNEHIKKTYRKGNPFNRGVFMNFISVFCAPHYPSYYQITKGKKRDIELMAMQSAAISSTSIQPSSQLHQQQQLQSTNNQLNNDINNNSNRESRVDSTPPPHLLKHNSNHRISSNADGDIISTNSYDDTKSSLKLKDQQQQHNDPEQVNQDDTNSSINDSPPIIVV